MKLISCFSFRFAYCVMRKPNYHWMRVAVRDWAKLVRDMHWRKYLEGSFYEKRQVK